MRIKKNDWILDYYKQYRDSLLVIALSYAGNRVDAEDLVQAAFAKALLSYRNEGSFLYWINRVMRNEWYSIVKKRSRERCFDELADVFMEETDPLERLIQDERKRWLAKAIARLPERYRDIMIEYVYLERSDEQIAADHGTTAVNVRKIRSRAKKMLEKERQDGKDE